MKSNRMILSVSDDWFALIDEWRRVQPDIPNRSEAVRRLVALGLEHQPDKQSGEGEDRASPSLDGGKQLLS